jgi:hypothetical protein
MGNIEKPYTDEYKEIKNNLNYDANCTLTSSFPILDLEKFQHFVFVLQSVQINRNLTLT